MPSVRDGGRRSIIRRRVLDAAGDRQAILRQADAAGAQIGLDLLVLRAVEAVGLRAARPGFCAAASPSILRARQQVVEEVLHHAGELAARRGRRR